jgi:hypothetical protein
MDEDDLDFESFDFFSRVFDFSIFGLSVFVDEILGILIINERAWTVF